MTRLRATGLRKRFGRRWVVDQVDLEVEPGEIVGLLGPNGAGKTTTFYMIVGIESVDEGRILLGETELTRWPLYRRARAGIRYLPQEPSVFRELTVLENLLAVLEIAGTPRRDQRPRAMELLEEFGIAQLADRPAYALSGGERRRLEIARALVTDPSFFLLDEPFAGIDPIAVGELQELVRGIRARGVGVLISDHNVRETLTLCDRAYILHEGRVLLEGTPDVVAADARARAVYLGEEFRL